MDIWELKGFPKSFKAARLASVRFLIKSRTLARNG
jgi:hypothetical protein